MSNTPNGVVLITGCSSGIGYVTSSYLARRGYQVYASMRDPARAKSLLEQKEREGLPIRVLKLDVTIGQDATDAVRTVVSESGRIDALINNAGFGLEGTLEDMSVEELRGQFETNFFGAVRLAQEVIPVMRSQGSGYIVNISSAAGRIATPFMGAYCATKFAIEGLSEALHHELRRFGIRVVLVEPGYIKTNFGRNVRVPAKLEDGRSAYLDLLKRAERGHERAFSRGGEPELVAKTIFKALSSKRPKLRYTVGLDASLGVFFRRLVPERTFLWAIERYYNL